MAHLKQLVELDDNTAVMPSRVALIKRGSLDGDTCIVFFSGSSPVDGGFLIHRPFDEVFDDLNQALQEEFEETVQAEEDEEDDDADEK